MEMDQLTKESEIEYKKMVIDHDDHSHIYFDCAGLEDWKTCHHKITIKDVTLQMIDNGEINKHLVKNSDNDHEKKLVIFWMLTVDRRRGGTKTIWSINAHQLQRRG
jgi:hypothetical protein